jgi:hypothetical protein
VLVEHVARDPEARQEERAAREAGQEETAESPWRRRARPSRHADPESQDPAAREQGVERRPVPQDLRVGALVRTGEDDPGLSQAKYRAVEVARAET